MTALLGGLATASVLVLLLLVGVPLPGPVSPYLGFAGAHRSPALSNGSAVGNFSQVIDRIVVLLGLSGGGLLAIVWTRVALSWFSNDVTKKVQAKDRARDALVGTLLFAGALSGLIWGLARWVLTGS